MLDISRETLDSYKMIWLNEKHTEKGLVHENLPIIARNYLSKYRKHRYEPVDEPKNRQTDYF